MARVKVTQYVKCPDCKKEITLVEYVAQRAKKCSCGSDFLDKRGHLDIQNYYEKGG